MFGLTKKQGAVYLTMGLVLTALAFVGGQWFGQAFLARIEGGLPKQPRPPVDAQTFSDQTAKTDTGETHDAVEPVMRVEPNGDIYFGEYYRGHASGSRLTVLLTPTTSVSFTGNVGNLSFNPFFEGMSKPGTFAPFFSYYYLTFSTYIAAPNSGERANAPDFDCAQPFVSRDPWYYCKNLGNAVSMYQITNFNAVGFGTGGGSTFDWKKIFAIKAKIGNVFAVADISDIGSEFDPLAYDFSDYDAWIRYRRGEVEDDPTSRQWQLDSVKRVETARKKEILDELLADPMMLGTLLEWDTVIRSAIVNQ